jgi:DNA ligase-1
MADLKDGETCEMQGSGSKPYVLKNVGGVYSCSCPAWRNQSLPIERRTCKHLRRLRGDEAEEARIGGALPVHKAAAEGEEKEGPPVLLADRWDSSAPLVGWWMSEKLDGLRAWWDGRRFISRQGNLYLAPDWFVEGLPAVPLDGELWIGRKMFQRATSIVRRHDKTDLWREVRYVVFDAPAHPGVFEERLQFVHEEIARHKPPFAVAHQHAACQGVDHLRAELARVEALGGEGLMLRQPRSRYEAGRSCTLLKVKNFHDAEGRVVGHKAGAGRHAGRLGALQVEMADGTRVDVGTGFSDAEREDPPPVGSVITFRYQELSQGGVPRFPSYVGVRQDAAPAPVEAPKTKSKGTVVAVPEGPAAVAAAERTAGLAGGGAVKRYFELVDGTSKKFWEVSKKGTDVTTRYGRIGTEGRKTTKSFDDAAEAKEFYDKIIGDKKKKGYREKKR